MIVLKKYKPSDWTAITDAVEAFVPPQTMEEFLRMTAQGVAVTGVEDGVVMACGGVAYMSETEGTIWVRVSRKCWNHPYRWARTIRESFIMIKKCVDVNISTYILSDFCQAEKLARLIGLKKTDEKVEHNGNTYNRYMAVI